MNGIHDMGGMHGFGPVEIERDEPVFHAAWEGRARAMMQLTMARKIYNLDAFRYGIEQMEPADYLRASYFERWLTSVEYHLDQQGVVTREEMDARIELLQRDPAASTPVGESIERPRAASAESESAPPAITPRFAVGDAVVTRTIHPQHHTRIPRYARGKRGVVNIVHGPTPLPDTRAHGLGDEPGIVYSVRFAARELWGESAEPRQTVSIDLWESYLLPAPAETE